MNDTRRWLTEFINTESDQKVSLLVGLVLQELLSRQTATEQATKATKNLNAVGFTAFDANSGTEDAPHYRHAINIGSVGKPKDGDPRGTYAMLEWDEHSSLKDPGSVRVQFIRFEYDVEKAAIAVENSPLPNAYATALRVAK